MKNINWYIYGIDNVCRERWKSGYGRVVPYSRRKMYDYVNANDLLRIELQKGQPFFAGRMGLFELAAMRTFEFSNSEKYELVIKQIYECAGFFPQDISLGRRFLEEMIEALREVNILACSGIFAENYFMNTYMNKDACGVKTMKIMEPWRYDTPWTEILKGKKVLVVHPFEESIRQQYAKREHIFKGTQILPEFELITYKALQTTGDLMDERFENWFEALEYMHNDIRKLDYDIALLGCGAYGFPLASRLKKDGKQVVHMGGVLQILFGIMGKRWDGTGPNSSTKEMQPEIAKYYNENWTYPKESETPVSAGRIEYGPYWK